MSRIVRFALLLALAVPVGARAQIEGVRREEVDAGVHQPVLTRAPQLLQFVQAAYPPEAEKEGLTAEVHLQVTIGADGSVADAKVAQPVGHGFDEAALAAVKQFRFSPAEVDGVPAPIQIEYVYHFTLTEKVKAPEPAAAPKLATLKGQVISRGNRKRVQAATVRCGDDPEAPEAVTDQDGWFELRVPPGECKLKIVANGFDLFQATETLAPGETLQENFYLYPKSQGFETVVRGDRDKKEVVRRTLERAELENIPGSFGDPLRVIQDLPGVARARFGVGALIIRGASPAETATQIDSVPVPTNRSGLTNMTPGGGLFHLGLGPSIINPQYLDRIDFFPGGFGAQYGRAIGGVVDVFTRRGASDTFHGEVKVDLLDSDVFVEAPVAPGISVSAAGRRSYIDALLPLVTPPNGLLVAPAYWDYQARVDVGPPKDSSPLSGQSSYYVMAFGSDDAFKLVQNGQGSNLGPISLGYESLFHDVKGDWTYRKGNLTSVFTPYLGYTLVNFAIGGPALGADDYAYGAREDLSLDLAPWITVRTGVDVVGDHLVGHATLPVLTGVQTPELVGGSFFAVAPTQQIQMVINSFNPAVYAETDLKWGPFTATPGIRLNYDRELGHDQSSVDPRLWLRYRLLERTELKGSVGLYSQPAPSVDLVAAPFGNPNLTEQRAFQSSLGIKQKFTDAINIDVTGFFNRRYNLVVRGGPTVQNPDGTVTQYQYGNNGLGRAYGLEVLLRHEVTKNFFGWLAYTLSRSEVRREGDANYVLSTYDQTHILTVIASYKLPYGWEVGGRFQYTTGNPITPLAHSADIEDVDQIFYSPTYGATNSARLPAFNELDLRVDKYFVFKQWTLDVFLNAMNVYNAKNVEANFYDYRFRFRYDIAGLPFIPDFGLKGSW